MFNPSTPVDVIVLNRIQIGVVCIVGCIDTKEAYYDRQYREIVLVSHCDYYDWSTVSYVLNFIHSKQRYYLIFTCIGNLYKSFLVASKLHTLLGYVINLRPGICIIAGITRRIHCGLNFIKQSSNNSLLKPWTNRFVLDYNSLSTKKYIFGEIKF